MDLLFSRLGGLSRTCLDQNFRITSGEPCLAYLGHGKVSKKSIPRETAALPSNTSGDSRSSSQESTNPIGKDSTGWPVELPSRNIYDYPDRDYDPQICVKHLQALDLYWCPLDIVRDHLPCRRFFMAKVHQLYGKKTSAPPSDPAVHIATANVAERPVIDVSFVETADVGRSPAEARKPRSGGAKLKFAPSRSIGAIVSPGPECAWFKPKDQCHSIAPKPLDRFLPGEKRFPVILTKTPPGVGKQNHEQGLKLAHFTIDESVDVPPSRYDPGLPFTIDERAKKERLTFDQIKCVVTSYCYRAETKRGYQPDHRRKSFEVSAVLLTIVLHLRPGELRNIRWRDLKTSYIAFPGSPHKARQKVSYGTFTEVVVDLLKSWRTDAELGPDVIFDFTERTLERIVHRVLGENISPKDLRYLKEFHIIDESPEHYSLAKALRTLKAGVGLRSGELWKTPEEIHRYDTGLEHGFAHPDPQVTRHVKKRKVSGWTGKGVDH